MIKKTIGIKINNNIGNKYIKLLVKTNIMKGIIIKNDGKRKHKNSNIFILITKIFLFSLDNSP